MVQISSPAAQARFNQLDPDRSQLSNWRAGGYRTALTILATVFFMWGFVTVLNDILAPHLKAVFDLSYVQTMFIQFVFFSTYFVMALPSAKLLDHIGYQRAIALGLAVTGVGALIFLPAASYASYPIFLSGLFVLATGITMLQVSANPYVTMLGSPATASSRLNLVQAFNALGTTVGPSFGGLLILSKSLSGTSETGLVPADLAQRMQDALAVRTPYAIIAGLLFLLALIIFAWRLPSLSSRKEGSSGASDSLWRHRQLVLGVGGIFFYVGAEVSVGSFMINYISSPHVVAMSHAHAAFYVTLFWGAAMIGRFIGAGIMRRVPPARALSIVAIAATALLGTSILSGGWLALTTIILVGLANSIMFPTIFTLAIEGLGALTARGSALLIMAVVGGAVLPLLQGALADRFGLRPAFIIPIFCYLYILVFAIICQRPKAPNPA